MKLPKEIEQYLLSMIEEFCVGNDNLYPVGTDMQCLFESCNYEDVDFMGEEEVQKFQTTRNYLDQFGPIQIIFNDVTYTYTVLDNDIKMEWIEPNWDEIN